MSHTPGPWKFEQNRVAALPWRFFKPVGERSPLFAACAYKADAHLIAAAPDLLAALEEVCADLVELAAVFGAAGNDTTDEQAHLEAADRAIAKAKGETA